MELCYINILKIIYRGFGKLIIFPLLLVVAILSLLCCFYIDIFVLIFEIMSKMKVGLEWKSSLSCSYL
jgi:hypothetical protein